MANKVQEGLNWYGHVVQREEHYVGRRAMEIKVGLQRRRKRGKPKRRLLEVYDSATWRRMTSYVDTT